MTGFSWLVGFGHDVSSQARDDHGRFAHGSIAVVRQGNSFHETGGDKLPEHQQERLKALRIPPAWKEVRVSKDPESSLQAIGKDKAGRTQYLYSSTHRRQADQDKFLRMKELLRKLPSLQKQLEKDITSTDPAVREPASVLALIARTGFRIGGGKDVHTDYEAIGASTLKASQVKFPGPGKVRFTFRGKKGVMQRHTIQDQEIADMLRPRVLEGGRLFKTTQTRVREYLKGAAGSFTPKDLRTVVAGEHSLQAMEKVSRPRDEKSLKRAIKRVAEIVAKRLGNTAAIAMKSYIPPEVFSEWKAHVQGMLDRKSGDLSVPKRKKPPRELSDLKEGDLVRYHPDITSGKKARLLLLGRVAATVPETGQVRLKRRYTGGREGPERTLSLDRIHHVHGERK